MKSVRASADIGGTFTDVVLIGDDGTVIVTKVASTPDDYSQGVVEALTQAMRKLEIGPEEVTEVSHGFTVASNAILERRGERTALITTEGFRDVLELARIRTPRLYDLYYRKPVPLVERRLRLEVKERVNFQGEVLSPLEMADVERAVEFLSAEKIQSVAISLIHAYANPDHENQIASYLKSRIPDLSLSVSSSLLPEMGEYERTSTTVINAYVRPVVASYLTELDQRIQKMGVRVPLTVMQSSGGLAPVELAVEKPMYCVESGPAAGVVAAFHLGRRLGLGDMITFDMGGTTAKASIIEAGEILRAPEYEVGGGMSVGHRLLKGSGYILRVPTIDLAEVSAGGGSVAWVDKGGALQVGPRSAGAVPGPVCYGKGGSEPTVTDANALLGYLNPDYLLGGDFRLNRLGAERALLDNVGEPLAIDATEAAYGIHRLVNSNMARAVSAVSQERGRDPRRFTLVAFGGGGPVHAAGLARTLGIEKIIIPPSPGVFSAFGLLFADVEHHFSRSYLKEFSDLDLGRANQMLEELVTQGRDLLLAEGFPEERQKTVAQVDMKYLGQTSHLTVNLLQKEFDSTSLTQLGESFQQEHERTYGYRLDAPFQLCGLKTVERGISLESRVPESVNSIVFGKESNPSRRQVFFGKPHEWVLTPVVRRSDLEGSPTDGPLVVEEYDSTTLIPPGWCAALDSFNNITLERLNELEERR